MAWPAGAGGTKTKGNPPDASAVRARLTGADNDGLAAAPGLSAGRKRTVGVVAMTGHLEGFLSGVNNP